jgi:hypothetical protein
MLDKDIQRAREALEAEMEKGNFQSELTLALSQELDTLVAQYYRTYGKTYVN